MCNEYKILERVDSPSDLRTLKIGELREYCNELRRYVIEECATNPGHLSSSLGVVELTAALHYVYNTPTDSLIWDVGHQTYPHKIITGRREAFRTKRCKGGISGFPLRSESCYDSFGGGHASVSISAAYGVAKAAHLAGRTESTVAVIGDGSMTGGLAFEGLNNLGADHESDVLIVLNDNHMSIDNATGALSDYLLRVATSTRYNRFKDWLWGVLNHFPRLRNLFRFAGRSAKQGLLRGSKLFDNFHIRYFGPIDGHDIERLVSTLQAIKGIPGAKILHVVTTKGKGYQPAENNTLWHAPGRFDPATGERVESSNGRDRFQDVFGQTLLDLASLDSRVVGVTPAMLSGSSMNIFQREFPDRCFDVGIAEGHAVTFSAGLAVGGARPFCNIYSTFMQRAYDNVIHDVALQSLPVVLCLDRGGLVGEDGATHHGVYDLAYLSAVPNLVVAAPRSEIELRNMMYTALKSDRPFAVRYPRGSGDGVLWRDSEFESYTIGEGVTLREGSDRRLAVVTIGSTATAASAAIDRLGDDVSHFDLRFAKPLDESMLRRIGAEYSSVITVEDGSLRGGVGEAVTAFLARESSSCKVVSLGIPDRFVEHGTVAELRAECGIDSDGIYAVATKILKG